MGARQRPYLVHAKKASVFDSMIIRAVMILLAICLNRPRPALVRKPKLKKLVNYAVARNKDTEHAGDCTRPLCSSVPGLYERGRGVGVSYPKLAHIVETSQLVQIAGVCPQGSMGNSPQLSVTRGNSWRLEQKQLPAIRPAHDISGGAATSGTCFH